MNSTPLNTKTKEPCYRHGQIIEEKKEIQKSPTSKSGQKIDVKSPNRNVQPEKVVVPFRPRPNDHFVEETVEDLVDEDERFPLYKPENKPRAEPPAIDKEPVKAVVTNQKPKETKTYVEPTPVVKEKRKLSQENIVIQDQRNHMTMVKSDKDLRASVVSEKTKPRQTTPNLEETEKALSASANGNFGMYGKFLGASTAVTEAELIAENKLLRHFLRDLNEILNQQMEKVKIEKIEEEHDWKKIEFKNKSSEEKMKTIVREIANNEKIMAINKEEYRKTEARKEGIKDANYVVHMQEEIDRIRTEIEDIKRDNKKLMHSNGNVGKDLDLIENVKGVPVSIEETREKQVEMKRIGKKLEALKQKNAISEEERKYKIEKQKTLTTEIMKLEREVEAQGPMEVGNRASRLDYLKLMAEEALIKAKKKCKGKKMLIEREIEQAALYNEREKEHIERLDAMLKDQSAALKGLSATTERPRMNNRSTQDLFDNHMRLSLEPEERNVWGSSNQIDDEKLEGLKVAPNRPLKTKSIERGGGRMINRDLFATHEVKKSNQSFSKYKHVIKRELVGDRRSMWREGTDGDRARMEQIMSPSPTGKHEQVTYTKPLVGLGHSSSVKRIGGKGIAEPTPFAYDMKQKARHFDSKDWHDNLEEGMSQGEETARKRQSKKEKGNQDEVTKLVKTLNPVKRKSQEDIMNESKNQQSSVDLKRNGQPDNSQSKSSVQPGKKTIDLKAKGGKPGKKMAQQDFDELEFDD